jgi:hypothetical protein
MLVFHFIFDLLWRGRGYLSNFCIFLGFSKLKGLISTALCVHCSGMNHISLNALQFMLFMSVTYNTLTHVCSSFVRCY